ncbi:MAG: hypothetical protein HKN25_00480 [Pyrinomonadaceae bacterium]|nr:hypothetical protein [Pyrinomonadaceae bacterium]
MNIKFFRPGFSSVTTLVVLCFLVLSIETYSQILPFDSERWEIAARESKVIEHLGRKALYLKGGKATVKNSEFRNGIIEFDIAFTPERGFMGAFWRLQDPGNYEEFYVRPHQSGLPDANQYQPLFNGVAGWQLYHGEEYSTPFNYDFEKWMRIKIVVSGKNAEIYIKDMEKPLLFVSELKRPEKTGKVGLVVSNFAPSYFSNFSFTLIKSPKLKGTVRTPKPIPLGTVMNWDVSNPIDAKSLEKKYQLNKTDKDRISWKRIAVENGGFVNLARLSGRDDNRDTVFAKLLIRSDRKQIKKFKFGYSDIAKVYLNDRLIYGGSNMYQSRDYRYLGTIGLFDEIYLPLEKGDNELLIAVTENFGGWGVTALFDDMTGIVVR